MRLLSYLRDGEASFGCMQGDGQLMDLGGSQGTLAQALERHPDPLDIGRLRGERIALTDVELLPPIPAPGKVLCVGFNFRAHTQEATMDVPAEPTLFARYGDTFVGHEQPVVRPGASHSLDWEGELAVVIGRRAWHVPAVDALRYVAGYSCIAENSVRDWQAHGTQATAGKNFWRSGAFGPALVTADEVGDPGDLRLETRLNGERVQQATTSELVFGVAEIIAYITQFSPLAPGDVIAMGTPSGTGFRRDPPRYLAPGDTVEIEVERVGLLRHTVIDEPAVPAAN